MSFCLVTASATLPPMVPYPFTPTLIIAALYRLGDLKNLQGETRKTEKWTRAPCYQSPRIRLCEIPGLRRLDFGASARRIGVVVSFPFIASSAPRAPGRTSPRHLIFPRR